MLAIYKSAVYDIHNAHDESQGKCLYDRLHGVKLKDEFWHGVKLGGNSCTEQS